MHADGLYQNRLSFAVIYPELKQRLQGKIIVAHNESFDRGVLKATMADAYDTSLPNGKLQLALKR